MLALHLLQSALVYLLTELTGEFARRKGLGRGPGHRQTPRPRTLSCNRCWPRPSIWWTRSARMPLWVEKGGGVCSWGCREGSGGLLQVGFPGVDKPAGGCRSSLRRGVAAWSATTGAVGRGQSEGVWPVARSTPQATDPSATDPPNPHRLQVLTTLSHPHQHRPAPMQIHPPDLPTHIHFTHRGLLRCGSEHPRACLGTSRGAMPRSFIASGTPT